MAALREAEPKFASLHEDEVWAALIPAAEEEDIFEFTDPWPAHANRELVRSALGDNGRTPLYSAPAEGGRTVYWVMQSSMQVNERAVEATHVTDIRGDAIIVSPCKSPRVRLRSGGLKRGSGDFGSRSSSASSRSLQACSTHGVSRLGSWTIEDLPSNILQAVFSLLRFSELAACSAVCQFWRQLIGDDEPLLVDLPICRRNITLPGLTHRPPNNARARARARSSMGATEPPFVLVKAAEFGNIDAMVLMGEEMEQQGYSTKGLEWRRKAARKGHQESQYKVGEVLYRGDGDFGRDPEEALVWLLRSARNPAGDPALSARAALLLGYLYMDGEGMQRPDNSEAVKWFKIAANSGSLEAEQTIGWLWNTGQY